MKIKLLLGLLMAGLLTGSVAFAAPIIPHYTSFGHLDATFGGTGIPNDAVAITTISNGGDTITLGLTATQRFTAPFVSSDGAGTFFATPGTSGGLALWNFDFYVNLAEGMSSTNVYDFKLVVQDNTTGSSETIFFGTTGTSFTGQDSWNLSFSFLQPGISFDPNAHHQYAFELQAFDHATGILLDSSAINVNVPDAGTTVALLGLSLVGMAGFGLRRRLAKA